MTALHLLTAGEFKGLLEKLDTIDTEDLQSQSSDLIDP
jgi:hypothetical protein